MSGSGKSSLVFNTICTEAQRQLVGTYSTYARRRLPQLTRSPVDAVRNISPCIVIDQKRLGASSRSTVGTVTEIYTYLRMLFSRCGRPFVGWSHRFSFNHPDGMCSACKGLGKRITVDVDKLLDLDRSVEEGAIRHPAYDIGKWYWREIVQTEVVPHRKPLRRFTATERERLLWADGVRIEKAHQGRDLRGDLRRRSFQARAAARRQGRGPDTAHRPTGTRGSSHAAIASGTLAAAVAGTSPRANVINSVDVHPASIWSSASASRRSMVSP